MKTQIRTSKKTKRKTNKEFEGNHFWFVSVEVSVVFCRLAGTREQLRSRVQTRRRWWVFHGSLCCIFKLSRHGTSDTWWMRCLNPPPLPEVLMLRVWPHCLAQRWRSPTNCRTLQSERARAHKHTRSPCQPNGWTSCLVLADLSLATLFKWADYETHNPTRV